MNKIFKTILCSIITCSLLFIPACNSKKNSKEITNTNTNVEGKTKYVIQLSVDNYKKYFDVTFTLRSSVHNTIITFSGCVYEAIYDDCVVTYNYAPYAGAESTMSESFELNLGGNGSIESKDVMKSFPMLLEL